MPDRPYHSEESFLRKMEAYYKTVDNEVKAFVDKYDALLIVGGSGPIVDLVNNERLHALILGFYRANEPIGAECYGVTCLAFARNWEDRKSIISGKHVTGHCIEYDYKYGTGFMGTELRHGPAALPARVHPPRRDPARRCVSRQLRPRDRRSSSTIPSSPAARRRTRT